jgi:hypothetical protein
MKPRTFLRDDIVDYSELNPPNDGLRLSLTSSPLPNR